MKEQLWYVGQWHSGIWTTGGTAEDYPEDDYKFIIQVMARDSKDAKRKGKLAKKEAKRRAKEAPLLLPV